MQNFCPNAVLLNGLTHLREAVGDMNSGNLSSEQSAPPVMEGAIVESRRREMRQRVLLSARLHPVHTQHFLLVTNLSRRGLRATAEVEPALGATIFVTLDDLTHCRGTIRWTQNGRFGMQFDKPLTILPHANASDEGSTPDHVARVPRLVTHWNGTVTICEATFDAKIRNVSPSGMMVETALPLLQDQKLLVQMTNGKIVAAHVRWTEGEHAGIQLSSPISLLQFSHGGL